MDTTFQMTALRATRTNIKKQLSGLTLDQLNHIPKGFNNNLLWNAGHVVVTQQLLCYRMAGLPVAVSEELIARYRKGSKPTAYIGETEKNLILELLDKTVNLLAQDLAAHRFKNYKTYTTSYGITLQSGAEAVYFNLAHEAMHLGSMIALRKQV